MIKKGFLLLLVAAAITASLLTQGTYAWFTDFTVNEKTFKIGLIEYTATDTLMKDDVSENLMIVPGEDLYTSGELSVVNHSNISTQIRFKVFISYTPAGTTVPLWTDRVYTEQKNGAPPYEIGDMIILDIDFGWKINTTADDEDEGLYCYEYCGAGSTPAVVPPAAGKTLGERTLKVFDQLTLDGDVMDNTFSGAEFTIKFVFQAKQYEYIEWENLGVSELHIAAGVPVP